MAQYYLRDNGSIGTKKKENKKSYLDYNKQVSEKIKQQKPFRDEMQKPVDYNSYTTKELRIAKDRLQKQMLKYSGTTNSKGNYTLKGFLDNISGKTRKKLEKDKTYQTAQDRLNQMTSILEQRNNEKIKAEGNFADRTANSIANQLENYAYAGEEVRKNPIQSIKTGGVGFLEGAQNSVRAIENSALDLGKTIFGNNDIYNDWYTRQKIEMQMREMGDPLKKTKTYKQKESGKLSEEQQLVYGAGENLGQMAPSIALSTVTGSPALGSAAFYAQAQDNYYNEAKQRGYDEKQARAYSLMMAGVELGVERLGFDQLSGLGEGSIVKAMFGEAAEEALTPYIDSGLRQVAFKERIDWNETEEEAISGAFLAMMTAGMTQMAGNGFAKIDNLVNKINTGEKITSNDLSEAFQEVQQADPGYAETMISEAVDSLDKDTINQIKNQMNLNDNQTKSDNAEEINNQIAPNITEQVETQSREEQEIQPQIKLSAEKNKENQYQFDFNEEIKKQGKKLNMSDKQITRTQNEVNTFQNNIINKDSSLQKAYETGNIALTKNGDVIKVSNEKDIKQLIELTVPNEKKVTVKAKDLYGEDYTIKKQSQKFLEGISTNEELFNKIEENKTSKQKIQDKKDAIRYEETFEKFRNAIDSNDTERSNEWEKVQDEHIVKTFSLDELQKQAGEEILKDIEKVKEEVDISIINRTADKHNMAQAAALASYYSGKGDWKNADKYRWKASSMSSMFGGNLVSTKLLYLDNPDGALNAYLAAVDETYKEDAKFHKGDVEWHSKNDMINPDGSINENSPYRLKDDVKDELRAKIQEWYKIENATSKEAKIKQKEIQTLIQQNLPSKPFGQKLLNFRRTAMLNNIGIWIRNSRQEVIDVTNAVATDVGASIADKKMERLRNKVENKVREEQGLEKQNKRYRTTSITTVKPREFMVGYKNGFKNHIESLKNDINMNRFGTRYDSGTNKISKSKVASVPDKITRESTNKLVMFLEKMNAVGMSSDTRFAEGYYAQAIYDAQAQFAANKAANKGVKAVVRTELDASGARITYIDPETGGIQNDIISNIKNNEELQNYIKENKYDLFEQSEIDAILDAAEKEANYRTLQDTGSLSRLSLTLVDKINEWSIEHLHYPLGSHFVPFIKASTESLRLAYNSSPIALININNDIKNFKKAVELNSKGVKTDVNLDIMQREISKKLGQSYGGTFCTLALLTAAASLYGAGKITGAQPDEKEGEEKYSIKIGDKNYSFDIDSITMFKLKMASVLTDKKNISNTDNIIKDIEQTMNNFASPVIDAVLEQTIISSFGEYFDKKYGTRWDTLAYQFVRLPQSFIPTLSKNIAVALDGFKNRDTSSDTYLGKMINGIGSKLPGVRSLYEEKKNEWGSVEDASLNIFEKAWNTMVSNDISANKTTKVDKELYDLYIATKSEGLFPSSGLKNTFSRGNNKYELNEKELKHYQNTYATTAFDMLEKLIDNQQYKKANQKDKTLMIKAVYRHAQDVGQNEYLKNKNISVKTDKSAIERVIEQNISYDSAIYQKNNPTRWKLYTSIISDYDDYKTIESRINEIKDTYSYDNGFKNKTQLNMVINYINGLNNLSATQKAMLIRMSDKSAVYKKSYSSYDSKIDDYLKNLHLSDEEYKYFINGNNLALEGYYGTYYTSKKNKN